MTGLVPLCELAKLKFETPLVPAADIGVPGEFRLVPASQLHVDPNYQRPILENGKRNIRRVVETFHHSKFNALMVSQRGKAIYVVLDGQHHGIAAVLHGGLKLIPCFVQRCTLEQEADAFATINQLVTRVHPLHVFRARVAAGEPKAAAAARVCRRAGVTVSAYPTTDLKPGETQAIGRIEQCIARYGADVTALTLQTIVRATAGEPRSYLGQGLIVGLAATLFANPKWRNAEALLQSLPAGKVRALVEQAQLRQVSAGGSAQVNVAALLTAYLEGKMGTGGGDQAPKKTLVEIQRDKARKAATASAAQKAHDRHLQEALKRAAPPPPRKIGAERAAEAEAIARHLKSKGARRFESGATGDPLILMEWLTRECGIATRLLSKAGNGTKVYLLGKKKHDLRGLMAVVNAERRKRKMEPLNDAA